jgi:hypothetical protein
MPFLHRSGDLILLSPLDLVSDTYEDSRPRVKDCLYLLVVSLLHSGFFDDLADSLEVVGCLEEGYLLHHLSTLGNI